jgi:hypothetical protein
MTLSDSDALSSANTIVPNQLHDLSPAAETEKFSLRTKARARLSSSVDGVPSAIVRGTLPSADTVSIQFVPPSIERALSSKFFTFRHPTYANHFAMIDPSYL